MVELTDAELVKAGMHLGFLGSCLDKVCDFVEWLHLGEACALIFKAWPEIEGDVRKLAKDVYVLAGKIRQIKGALP